MRNPKKFDYKNNAGWRMFRIMGEFTEGFEFISTLQNSVTIFGSARFDEKNKWCKEAEKLSRMLSDKGHHIVTGGGPGIMEAANKGAFGKTPGDSVGLNIQLPKEQRTNPYVERSMGFHYFFTRKVCMTFAANAFVYFPGGFGTLDELFEIITLVQTKKIEKIPIVLIGRDFWVPLFKLLKEKLVKEYGTLENKDLDLAAIFDNAEDAFKYIHRELRKKGRAS